MMDFLTEKEYVNKYQLSNETFKEKFKNNEILAFKSKKSFIIPQMQDEAKELLAAKKELLKDESIVLTMANHKGGVLKTTNTINLASSLSFLGYDVLIIDMDPQANASMIFNLENENINTEDNNIYKLLLKMEDGISDEEYLDAINKSIIPIEHEFLNGKLDIIPNDDLMCEYNEELRKLTNAESVLDELIKLIKTKHTYDFILIDTEPHIDTSLKMSLMASDYIIISLKADPYSAKGIASIFKPIKKMSRAYKQLKNKDITVLGGIIGDVSDVNLHKVMTEQLKQDIKTLSNNTAEIFNTFIPHTVKASEGHLDKGSVMFVHPKSKLNNCYLHLTNEIINNVLENEIIKKEIN